MNCNTSRELEIFAMIRSSKPHKICMLMNIGFYKCNECCSSYISVLLLSDNINLTLQLWQYNSHILFLVFDIHVFNYNYQLIVLHSFVKMHLQNINIKKNIMTNKMFRFKMYTKTILFQINWWDPEFFISPLYLAGVTYLGTHIH